ncbi:MAG: transglycosylase SLT domain-containing protein [Deltaproteobacteria bacterium]
MVNFVKNLVSGFLVLTLFLGGLNPAFPLDLSPEEMAEVLKISKNISLAKPALPDSKRVEYAVGIFKASKRFDIPPNLLIAIAAQETSFRENLPEGKAGEFGIVQIRKIWVKNRKLKKHFSDIKLKDLNNPEKAFLYAAWILRDLKNSSPKSAIPYWSFYNARGFKPRFKYFLAVNQKISYLNRGIPFTREIEENIQINGSVEEKSWQPDVRVLATTNQEQPNQKDNPTPTRKNPPVLITTASLAGSIEIRPNGWIAQALKRLQHEKQPISAAKLTVPITHLKTDKKSKQIAFSKTAAKLLKSVQD